MAKATASKIEPKTILLIVGVIVLVALAIWQATKSLAATGSDTGFRMKNQVPPESARPPGFPAGAAKGESKTGAD